MNLTVVPQVVIQVQNADYSKCDSLMRRFLFSLRIIAPLRGEESGVLVETFKTCYSNLDYTSTKR